MERQNGRGWRRRKGDFLEAVLRKSWYHLRLSVRHPARVPTWDAIVLTAASPEQAELYQWQLRRAKRLGHISESTAILAVPDPEGARIGSGAATFHALASLARHLSRAGLPSEVQNNVHEDISSSTTNRFSDVDKLPDIVKILARSHVLLLHAGGDSKRLPWANPMGKVFLPLPFLASNNPDGPVPLLFDHILAVSSRARQAFKNEGGIFIMTGDVLPCFDASAMILPANAACIITVPMTLDISSNHGVIVSSRERILDENFPHNEVINLLQKPNLKELLENNAVGSDGRALLDTGVIAVRGNAWTSLLKLAGNSAEMVSYLLKAKKEMSLYEDLVAAWVSAKHDWLKSRPLGKTLIDGLGCHKMFNYCADDLLFLHFGTSAEVLDHLGQANSDLVIRRHLSFFPETTDTDIATSAIILSSKISPGVSIGHDSMVYDSLLSGRILVGSQCIVVGVNMGQGSDCEVTGDQVKLILPDRHCLWEIPLAGSRKRTLLYCGLYDNPKDSFENGTFGGKPWKKVLCDLGIQKSELWDMAQTKDMCLWNAKLYPVLPPPDMLAISTWLMGSRVSSDQSPLHIWRTSHRVSLEELHHMIDFQKMCAGSTDHHAYLAAGIANASLRHGLLGRNLFQLCNEILENNLLKGREICKGFLDVCANLSHKNPGILPHSRLLQVQLDLLRACGDEESASAREQEVWAAVAEETASSVKCGFEEMTPAFLGSSLNRNSEIIFKPGSVRIELPVRVDFVGGWSDTPPWSLERPGCVLNMAINLEQAFPVGALIETTITRGIIIQDDSGNQLHIEDPTSVTAPFQTDDHFRLVKSALLVTGVMSHDLLLNGGLCIKTWAYVPRGSGLGTSSILAAAVVKALLILLGQDASNESVANAVLVLEQIMGTGGGWQDQIGGLYPGIKCTSSYPGQPLRLNVVPILASKELVQELEQRLLVVFTGQVRLAHQVLQKVVTRYLRRDNLLIFSVKRLAILAKTGQEALMNRDIDELGDIMLEAWRLHQELDPYCSNEFVDRLFAFADSYCSGYKLVGAGGGGFALLLAKDLDCALELKKLLDDSSEFDVKVYNWNLCLDEHSDEASLV